MKRVTSINAHIEFARRLTLVMDTRFNVLGVRVGIDPLLDIIPGVGNILAAATSFYLLWIGVQIQVPGHILRRMIWNILADYALGVVPVVGIVFDIFYRANVKNFALLEKYFDPTIIEGEVVSEIR